ncbi:ATP-binding cassette domain-containing protein [Alkalibaculum sp. M08DMB]|uniref:ATP-binding cassette domain-containing protein n=1 Tax=Alkalibaculum sporogenes TaxID=2655001 RepID=A0A6A7KA95_9FIRM|nr:ABC transporter ATP-binding protein [Alkalibaculum sporogenes]MPW26107.1 ATP-binding cassette domain-containing protein [Alkalibaculum sporogenes]
MIKVENLFYSYTKDSKYAVDDVNFEVAKGEAFGFLGPSGAGKSTTQGILTGLLPMQDGLAEVAGYNMKNPSRKMFNKLGVSFEQSNVYGKLTALENLEFYRKLFDVETIEPNVLLEIVGLSHVANKKASTFSKGMKHRLTFARSMLNKPELWFLDEPTTGLDPAIANQIKDVIKEKSKEGSTIFLTTHNMFIADELCDRVGFIIDGVLKLIDSPRNLKLKYGQKLVDIEYKDGNEIKKDSFSLIKEEERLKLNHIINNYEIELMHTKEATLEEIFIKVTGRGLV